MKLHPTLFGRRTSSASSSAQLRGACCSLPSRDVAHLGLPARARRCRLGSPHRAASHHERRWRGRGRGSGRVCQRPSAVPTDVVAAQGASTTLKLRFAVGGLIVCFSHPARPALGYAAVQVVSFLVWGCVLQRPLPCLDKTSSGLEMYLSIGNRQHFRWNSKDQRGLGMRRFASTRSGSATRSVLYYKNIYLCAIRFFRRYAILLSLVAPKGLRTR